MPVASDLALQLHFQLRMGVPADNMTTKVESLQVKARGEAMPFSFGSRESRQQLQATPLC